MTFAAIIVAAGRGTRAGAGTPKQWRPLRGKMVIQWTLEAFRQVPEIDQIIIVVHPDDRSFLTAMTDVTVVEGGATRAASVQNGLQAVQDSRHVLIHDAARCCVTPALICRVTDALSNGARAAAPALPVTDALWYGDGQTVHRPQSRDGLFRAQTPQGFELASIQKAHEPGHSDAADDVEVALAAGLEVVMVDGEERNLKITSVEDFARAEQILRSDMDVRIGTGYDVHAFGPGDSVVLCGVEIPHERTLKGHSDADVAMHALTDAIYGALAEGDIGRHFPPSDPQWKGAESEIFLAHAVNLCAEKGYRLNNIDLTLICERPKVTPHAPAMIATLSRLCGLPLDRVSVKATTSERLGFTGREEGIAAQAAVTLVPA